MSQPLFRFDPGWLFITAGLTLCVAGVLIPAQRDLHVMQQQLNDLRRQEQHLNQRLRAHAVFLNTLEGSDTALTRRLAETQLNLAPAGDTPILLAGGRAGAVSDWIEATLAPPAASQLWWPDSMLARLATGPHRLWLIGAGVLCVFIGLLIGPPVARAVAEETAEDEGEMDDAPFIDADDELDEDDEQARLDEREADEGEPDAFCEIVTSLDVTPPAPPEGPRRPKPRPEPFHERLFND